MPGSRGIFDHLVARSTSDTRKARLRGVLRLGDFYIWDSWMADDGISITCSSCRRRDY